MSAKTIAARNGALLVGAMLLAGCHTWEVRDIAPRQVVSVERPGEIRVEAESRPGPVRLKRPWLNRAALVGTQPKAFRPDPIIEVPVSDVRRLEVRRFSWTRTAALAGVGMIASFILSEWVSSQVEGSRGGGGWYGSTTGGSIFGCITCP